MLNDYSYKEAYQDEIIGLDQAMNLINLLSVVRSTVDNKNNK